MAKNVNHGDFWAGLKRIEEILEANALAEKERIAAAEKEYAESKARLKKIEALVGGISNNNGAFAEEYFVSALEDKKVFAGIQFDEFDHKVRATVGKLRDEFDMVLYNGDAVAILEVKYKVHLKDVEKLVTQKVPHFRALFPYYANHKIYLGIGSLAFYDDVLTKAKELGIGVLRQKGEAIETDASVVKAY